MSDANIFVGWKSGQSYTFVSTKSTGHSKPQPISPQDITVLPLQVAAPDWATLAFSFAKPIASGTPVTPSSSYIYAWSTDATGLTQSVDSNFGIHTNKGSFGSADFTTSGSGDIGAAVGKPAAELPSGWSMKDIYLIHGILMTIAWAVAPAIGIFIARYMKHLGHLWYQIHLGVLLLLTGGLSLAGFVLVLVYQAPPHFSSIHQVGFINLATWFVYHDYHVLANRSWLCNQCLV